MGDKEKIHKTGDIGWETKYIDVREGTKDVRHGWEKGDKGTGDWIRVKKLRKCMWCTEMIFAHAQPTSNQFSCMLSIRGNSQPISKSTFKIC
jgi:hypothetical protein